MTAAKKKEKKEKKEDFYSLGVQGSHTPLFVALDP